MNRLAHEAAVHAPKVVDHLGNVGSIGALFGIAVVYVGLREGAAVYFKARGSRETTKAVITVVPEEKPKHHFKHLKRSA